MSEADNVEVAVEATEAPARPEWLPEKFNTPEDLASSYSQLDLQQQEDHQHRAWKL